jgi:hypothetical protein
MRLEPGGGRETGNSLTGLAGSAPESPQRDANLVARWPHPNKKGQARHGSLFSAAARC